MKIQVTGGAGVSAIDVTGMQPYRTVQVDTAINMGAGTTGVYDVTSGRYGARGNGVADDRAAIQAALDEAYAAGGGIVYLPPGRTYGVSDYLNILSNTTVLAHGATIKGIANRGLAKLYRETDTTFTGYTGHSRIRIRGGIWDVNASDGTTGTVTEIVDAFLMGHNNDVVFDQVTVRNVSGAHGIDMTASQNVRVVGCRFEGFNDPTVDQSSSFREAIQIDWAIPGSGINGAFDNTGCRNVLIQDCYFGPSDRLGGFGRAVGSHTSVSATAWADNIQIIGNQIEATLQEGIRAYAWRNAIIADNVISGNGAPGIIITGPDPAVAGYANACQNISVRGNTVAGPTGGSSPIRVVGFATARPTGVAITGNTVTSSPSTGIYVSQADTPQVGNNKVLACTSSNIYAISCTSPAITGNHVSAAGGASIGVDTCTGGHVAANDVENAGGHGILVSGGSDVMVTGNRVYAAKGSGIRATTSTTRARIMGNTVIRGGQTPIGLDVTASATDCLIVGNDLTGGGWTAAGATAFNLVGTRQMLDWSGGSTAPGLNLAN
ncbi:right-handed parallel beta-helix repeat-containing protein [Streptomyces spiralis]